MQREIAGIICDLDGTLVDTEDLHLKAWYDIVKHYDATLPDGWEGRYMGNPDIDWAHYCVDTFSIPLSAEALLAERHDLYRTLLRAHGTRTAFPGVAEELCALAELGVKRAVGTNSPIENTTVALELAGISSFFPVVVAFGMTPRGKPAPDIFLAAAARLGLRPGECAVLEDTHPGVQAGKAAGAMVLAVTTTNPAPVLAAADMIFPSTRDAMGWVRDNCRAVINQ